ncbi:hypothetical protein AB0J91_19615, partial [Saccharopolyspora sp. NPDC049357]
AEEFQLDPADLALPLTVAVEAADAVLHLAFRRDPNGDQAMLAEAKDLVRGYLSNRITGEERVSSAVVGSTIRASYPSELPSPR